MSDELTLQVAVALFGGVVVAYIAVNFWRQLFRVSVPLLSLALVLAAAVVLLVSIANDGGLVVSFAPLIALGAAWVAAVVAYRLLSLYSPDLKSILEGQPPWDEPEHKRLRFSAMLIIAVVIVAVFVGVLLAGIRLLGPMH